MGDGLALRPGQVFGEGGTAFQEFRAGVLRRIVHRFGRAPRNTHSRTSRSCPRRVCADAADRSASTAGGLLEPAVATPAGPPK